MPVTRTGHGIRLAVRLTPKASKNRVGNPAPTAEGTTQLKCYVTAPPEGGKANAALIKLLAKALGCSKTSLEIISGASDRNKVIAVSGSPAVLMGAAETLIAKARSEI